MVKTNEHIDWEKLDKKEKSYTVKVLNWFHFRKNRLHQSWKREEVITWELIRALEILPKKYLLKYLLILIKKKNPQTNYLINSLLNKIDEVTINSYPDLGLSGNKKKSRSDIEIKNNDSCLWIEAKTQLIKEKDLQNQIKKQKLSPNLNKYKEKEVIALIPSSQEYEKNKITWRDLLEVIKIVKKENENKENEILEGYNIILQELINRMEGRNCYE